jgi:ketosteroid isomerase-like protein
MKTVNPAEDVPMRQARSGRYVWFALALCLTLVGCSRVPAEQRLRTAIAELQEAIEARAPARAVEHLAEDFVGSGNLDRDGARNLLRLMAIRHQQLGLTLGPMQLQLIGDRATVTFTAVATGGSGALIPQSARVWNVETAWRDEDGSWRLISAEWR